MITHIGEYAIFLSIIDPGDPELLHVAGTIIDRPSRRVWIVRTAPFGDVEEIHVHGPSDEDMMAHEVLYPMLTTDWNVYMLELEAQHRRETRYYKARIAAKKQGGLLP